MYAPVLSENRSTVCCLELCAARMSLRRCKSVLMSRNFVVCPNSIIFGLDVMGKLLNSSLVNSLMFGNVMLVFISGAIPIIMCFLDALWPVIITLSDFSWQSSPIVILPVPCNTLLIMLF